jgi:hypothetical protein
VPVKELLFLRRIERTERLEIPGLFILNLVAFFILWFHQFIPPHEAVFEAAVIYLLINGGFPHLILYLDFGTLGRELARSKFRELDSD